MKMQKQIVSDGINESYACHYPTGSGNPEKQFKTLDSRLRGNDRKEIEDAES